jgi:hypothetical protein
MTHPAALFGEPAFADGAHIRIPSHWTPPQNGDRHAGSSNRHNSDADPDRAHA